MHSWPRSSALTSQAATGWPGMEASVAIMLVLAGSVSFRKASSVLTERESWLRISRLWRTVRRSSPCDPLGHK